MLISVSNLAYIWWDFVNHTYQTQACASQTIDSNHKKYSAECMMAISSGLGLIAFALGHWFLADRYWMIGELIPTLKSESDNAQQSDRIKCVKRTSFIMIFLFFFFPLMGAVCFVSYFLSTNLKVKATMNALVYVFLTIPYFM